MIGRSQLSVTPSEFGEVGDLNVDSVSAAVVVRGAAAAAVAAVVVAVAGVASAVAGGVAFVAALVGGLLGFPEGVVEFGLRGPRGEGTATLAPRHGIYFITANRMYG